MKKLLLIILLGSVLVFSDISLASEEDEIVLKTTNVSEDVKKYATDNLSFYLKTMLLADGITGDLNEYVLGTPFSLLNNETSTDTIIFPILKGDNLIYNFYVQETDGEYVTKVTKELVDELNGLRKKI